MNKLELIENNRERIISLFGFLMVFVFGFFSGYYYILDKVDSKGITAEEPNVDCAELFNSGDLSAKIYAEGETKIPDNTVASVESTVKSYVASKNSKIFHISSCSSALKIKEENKVRFSSVAEAGSKGFEPHFCVGERN